MPPESFDPTNGGVFKAERLLTRSGEYVITASIAPMQPPADAITWGNRLFVRNAEGEYREGLVVMPLRTVGETQHAATAADPGDTGAEAKHNLPEPEEPPAAPV